MRRSVGLFAGLLLVFVALVQVPAANASSIGGGGFVTQLGARLDRPEAAPAVRAGVVYEATVVSPDKLVAFGMAGAKVGDRIRVTVLAGNKVTVSVLSPATPVAGAVRTLSPARSVSLKYNATGTLSTSD